MKLFLFSWKSGCLCLLARAARGRVAACGLVFARAGMQFVLFVANPPLVALFYSPVVEKEPPLILDIPQLRGMMLCPIDQDRTPCSSHASPARHVGPRTTLI